jgi:hypothetical protein
VSVIRKDIWLTNNQVNAYTGAGPLITDDHPLTEYFLLSGYAPRPADQLVLRLCLVVTGLLALLIIGAAVDSVSRRRTGVSAQPASGTYVQEGPDV